jgi:hypothetical protein
MLASLSKLARAACALEIDLSCCSRSSNRVVDHGRLLSRRRASLVVLYYWHVMFRADLSTYVGLSRGLTNRGQ